MEDWYQVERPTVYQIPGGADILDGFYHGSLRNAIQVSNILSDWDNGYS